MQIETVDELADQIADWIGCYGACKSESRDGCVHSEKDIFCCRVGFHIVIQERIRNAVHNEDQLSKIDAK